jgi:hypothetical protein
VHQFGSLKSKNWEMQEFEQKHTKHAKENQGKSKDEDEDEERIACLMNRINHDVGT